LEIFFTLLRVKSNRKILK